MSTIPWDPTQVNVDDNTAANRKRTFTATRGTRLWGGALTIKFSGTVARDITFSRKRGTVETILEKFAADASTSFAWSPPGDVLVFYPNDALIVEFSDSGAALTADIQASFLED